MKNLLVVTAVCTNDFKIALKRAKWMEQYGPSGHFLLLVNDGSLSESEFNELAQAYLPSFTDVIRRKIDKPRDTTWPAGVNYVFRQIARKLSAISPFVETSEYTGWFFFEPDVTPLNKDWLSILDQQYNFQKKPFMGVKSVVYGTKSDGEKVTINCMNGAGIYPLESVHFTAQMMLTDGIPWDVAGLATGMQHKIAYIPEDIYVLTYGITECQKGDNGQILATKTVQDGSVSKITFDLSKSILHHGCKDGSLIDILTSEHPLAIDPPKNPLPVVRNVKIKKVKKVVQVPDHDAIIKDFRAGSKWGELVGKYRVSPSALKLILAPHRG